MDWYSRKALIQQSTVVLHLKFPLSHGAFKHFKLHKCKFGLLGFLRFLPCYVLLQSPSVHIISGSQNKVPKSIA